ncbi:dethiobiotin synthetase [Dyadobacter sp. BE34]|uniref:ATP-dependent dethiobiotin synthetase BioD n=1 Tax=Dyadobacter fermentans TaxID=94254 RepID=A0ABU1QUY7_9BACT|nr:MULTISPECIES: dethiobiotin synthase [Dyadobacter]MDR6804960.1 dethiobiotin synthetase [Dyadobacter fermentans]MDR7043281.1 dethiobiotin synthetase [Dyadobacter sp. BE242]MDR7197593.1 dethiobiotin synthetase [Dyadobacter sp. BE34]MDR7214974.1 dethiobiotin synthetase [Dyadobacter sp. BE31]MDR7262509.1 dethiobiotin synthetase [Dyadobacter sp. BE32]
MTPNRTTLFVTGIGTDVGKTVCSAVLAEWFKADYWKPVQAGTLSHSDRKTVSRLTSDDIVTHAEAIRLRLAASPHKAARKERKSIAAEDLVLPETSNHLIIEGAGGLYVPINDRLCVIDWIESLGVDVALVVRNYLGCINHTLLSVRALQHRSIPLKYLIFNGPFDEDTRRVILSYPDIQATVLDIPDFKTLSPQSIARAAHRLRREHGNPVKS